MDCIILDMRHKKWQSKITVGFLMYTTSRVKLIKIEHILYARHYSMGFIANNALLFIIMLMILKKSSPKVKYL